VIAPVRLDPGAACSASIGEGAGISARITDGWPTVFGSTVQQTANSRIAIATVEQMMITSFCFFLRMYFPPQPSRH
jgi:hypothetical protein